MPHNCRLHATMKRLKMTLAVIHIVMVDFAKDSTAHLFAANFSHSQFLLSSYHLFFISFHSSQILVHSVLGIFPLSCCLVLCSVLMAECFANDFQFFFHMKSNKCAAYTDFDWNICFIYFVLDVYSTLNFLNNCEYRSRNRQYAVPDAHIDNKWNRIFFKLKWCNAARLTVFFFWKKFFSNGKHF